MKTASLENIDHYDFKYIRRIAREAIEKDSKAHRVVSSPAKRRDRVND